MSIPPGAISLPHDTAPRRYCSNRHWASMKEFDGGYMCKQCIQKYRARRVKVSTTKGAEAGHGDQGEHDVDQEEQGEH